MENIYGQLAALVTAVFWAVTAIAFELSSKRIGSIVVNFIRICAGFLLLSLYTLVRYKAFFPESISRDAWFWLSLSGFIGFFIGDLLLFRAFVLIGARLSMLIYASVPPVTAVIAFFFLGEKLSATGIAGMAVTLGGIVFVLLRRRAVDEAVEFKKYAAGILFAVGGTLGQAVGLILSKYVISGMDPFVATQIRSIPAIVGLGLLVSITGRWKRVFDGMKNFPAMKMVLTGAFFGPFLGVSFSLLALIYTTAAVASTIMAIVPVLIILPAVFLFKERISASEIIGTVITVAGVAILFY